MELFFFEAHFSANLVGLFISFVLICFFCTYFEVFLRRAFVDAYYNLFVCLVVCGFNLIILGLYNKALDHKIEFQCFPRGQTVSVYYFKHFD